MKNILLGVTGSVAAIKVAQLAKSIRAFANLKIVITESAEYFIKSDIKAIEALSVPIYSDKDEWPPLEGAYDLSTPILHIELRRWADCLIVAPLDANTLAKIALGMCDNLLTSVVRAWNWNKEVFLCPAMNTFMWENKPTAQQIETIKNWGATIIEPIEKKLACQDIGMGAMAEVKDIVLRVKQHGF